MCRHCSSPGWLQQQLTVNSVCQLVVCLRLLVFFLIRERSLWGRTLCEADGRDPGVEGGGVWLQVEWLRVGLGTLLRNEVQLGAVAWLQRVPEGKTGSALKNTFENFYRLGEGTRWEFGEKTP